MGTDSKLLASRAPSKTKHQCCGVLALAVISDPNNPSQYGFTLKDDLYCILLRGNGWYVLGDLFWRAFAYAQVTGFMD
jgi:hypothetical protein